MRLADLVDRRRVAASLGARGKLEALNELAALLSAGQAQITPQEFCQVLIDRERLRSTGVGSGVAIPHGKVPGLRRLTMAVGLSRRGIEFEAADGRPVQIFMALAAPVTSAGDHLKALARIARLCNDPAFRERLLECRTNDEVYEVLVEEDEARR
jgi:PTS system nitrogen regulatory IIA component